MAALREVTLLLAKLRHKNVVRVFEVVLNSDLQAESGSGNKLLQGIATAKSSSSTSQNSMLVLAQQYQMSMVMEYVEHELFNLLKVHSFSWGALNVFENGV